MTNSARESRRLCRGPREPGLTCRAGLMADSARISSTSGSQGPNELLAGTSTVTAPPVGHGRGEARPDTARSSRGPVMFPASRSVPLVVVHLGEIAPGRQRIAVAAAECSSPPPRAFWASNAKTDAGGMGKAGLEPAADWAGASLAGSMRYRPSWPRAPAPYSSLPRAARPVICTPRSPTGDVAPVARSRRHSFFRAADAIQPAVGGNGQRRRGWWWAMRGRTPPADRHSSPGVLRVDAEQRLQIVGDAEQVPSGA